MPSIGKDLAKIRAHVGLSIHDIQNATKIPVSTLKTIENDTIFSRHHEGKTYIRSFVRSYGRALKIDSEVLIKALDQHERGNYHDLLLQQFPDLIEREPPAQTPPQAQPEEPLDQPFNHPDTAASGQPANAELFPIPDVPEKPEEQQDRPEAAEPSETKHSEPEEPVIDEPVSPAEEERENTEEEKNGHPTAASQPKPEQKPTVPVTPVKPAPNEPPVRNVDWADMGKKFKEEKKQVPAWLIGLVILLVVAAGTAYVLYHFGYLTPDNSNPSEQTTPQNPTTQSALSLDLEEPGDVPPNDEMATSELDEILYVTVYAAYDKLDPVRVWSDTRPRLHPYWLDQGVALQFEFRDTIQVRGPYEHLLLFKNGHRIDGFFENYYKEEADVVELTRDLFAADSKWATEISFELPEGVPAPDSLALRPTF